VSGHGVKDALFAIVREIDRAGKKDESETPEKEAPWRP
jgi:hypothetical protein